MIRIEDLHKLFSQHTGVATDTRRLQPGDLFFCLKGPQHDGNAFAQQAVEAGASFVITDDPENVIIPKTILVDDVLTCLQNLAAYHRNLFRIPVIGITGTNGKTTTKELITAVLSKKYKTVSTTGNLNNHIGVPLTLLKLKADTEFAIIEMGANHPGEIAELCEIARPNAGIVTNVGKAHLEGFGHPEAIIETKTALYRSVGAKGPVFIYSRHLELRKKAKGIHYIIYGPGKGSACRGKIVKDQPTLSVAWGDHYEHKTGTHLAGSWNLENILAAACIGRHFGVDDTEIHEALASYIPLNMRSQLIETGNNTVILDAYNANPGSMEKALTYFFSLHHDHKWIILGDMLELGAYARDEHQHIIHFIESWPLEKIILVGPEFKKASRKTGVLCFDNVSALTTYLKEHPAKDKLILLKGSRGIGLENVMEQL